MRKLLTVIPLLAIVLAFAPKSAHAAGAVPDFPIKNTVTLVDLGATTCIPCRMMMPILEEVKKEYQGRVAVVFVNVWDPANAGEAKKFKVRAIPTQIFFDRQGKEVFRHVGFFDKKSVAAKLNEILGQK